MFILAETFKEEFNYKLNQLRRITTHGPSLGRYVEYLLINLFKKYLPQSLDFTSGFVQGNAPNSKCSTQIDVICYDRFNFPLLFDIGEFKVIPAKSVKGLIEIKSTLTKNNLLHILQNSTQMELVEVSIDAKMYLLSIYSKISAKNAFNIIKDFYSSKPNINKLFSTIYSLSWNEIIISNITKKHQEDNFIEIKVEFIRLKLAEKENMAPFISMLMKNLYGIKVLNSVINHLNQSLFYPLETFSFKVYIRDDISI